MTDVRVVPFLVSEVRLPPVERELLGREWWPSYAHAVIHRDGVFLFDNGVGIALADLTGAANCHLHFDHSGQNARLRSIPIFVQRREWAMVHAPDYTVAEWVDAPGLSHEIVDGETEVAPGLRLIATPGHTEGHRSLVLDTPEGTVVFAGQAVQSRAEWEGATEPSASGPREGPLHDPYVASVERLRELRPARVHFAHDPSVWER